MPWSHAGMTRWSHACLPVITYWRDQVLVGGRRELVLSGHISALTHWRDPALHICQVVLVHLRANEALVTGANVGFLTELTACE